MCVIELEPCDLWEETPRKARKTYVCNCCGGSIDPGEVYIAHFSKFEGDITSERMCALCLLAAEHFREMHKTRSNPSGMRDLMQECVVEESNEYNEETDEYSPNETGMIWKRYLDEMDARRQARMDVGQR